MKNDRFQLAHECIRENVAPTLITTEWFANFRGKVAGALQTACQDRHLEQSFDAAASHIIRQAEQFRAAQLFARIQAFAPGVVVSAADQMLVDASLGIIDSMPKGDAPMASWEAAVDTVKLKQALAALVRVLDTTTVVRLKDGTRV